MPKRSPLHEQHTALDAIMTDFAGWDMPLRYGSETAEHQAVRTTAGLFDLSHMGEVEVTGPEAARALDHALVSEISAIALKRAKYTMICQEDGGILDDLVVYRLDEDRYFVVVNASNVAVVAEAITARAQGFEATVQDRSEDWALIALQGPVAAEILAEVATGVDLDALRYFAIEEGTVAGRSALLARTGYTGEDGFEIFCAPADAGTIWQRLLQTGSGRGVTPAGLASRDSLRLEAAMPLYGHELSTKLTPHAAGQGRVVKFDKEQDFVGRDTLAARAESEIPRKLVGLVPSGRRAPRAGYTVLDADAREPVGEVTSGAPSPTLGHPIAMAYLDISLAEEGTTVQVDVRGKPEPARVVTLPFYRRNR